MKQTYNLGIFLSLLLIGCSENLHQNTSGNYHQIESIHLLPIDPAVKIGTLDNGLKYYIRKNHKPENRAVLRLAVNAGSILEDHGQQGLAHFVEHMAFNGSEHFNKNELVDYLEGIGMRFGADLNAHTSFDETVYKLQVPMDDPEALLKAFQILEDWAHGLSLDPKEIDKERGVIKEEWRLRRGAWMRMWDKQATVLYKGSMYSKRLPIGDMAVVDTAHYETFRNFYRDWYRPNLMAVVAVGDFDTAEIETLIKKHFSQLSNPPNSREREIFPVPDHDETLVVFATDPEAPQSRVSVYFKQPIQKEKTDEDYRNVLVENLYSNMLNARFDEITQKPNAPFMFAYSFHNDIALSKSAYVLMAGVKEDAIQTGLEAILTEAERVFRFGFTPTELDRQKMDMMRSMQKAYDEREKTESKRYVNEYVRNYLQDEPIPGIEYELLLYKQYLPTIQLDEINKLSQTVLKEKNRVIVVNAPEKDELILPKKDALLSVFDKVKTTNIAPYVDSVSDEPLVKNHPKSGEIVSSEILEDIGVEKLKLSNGITVLLKQTPFKNDEIIFRAFSPGGKSLTGDESYPSADASSSIIQNCGVGEFTQIELEKKLAGKVVSVRPYFDGLFEGVVGSASPKDIEEMFQLIYLRLAEPRMDEESFEATLSRWRGFLENRSSQPEAAYGDTIQVTMAQYHERVRPWSMEYLEEMNLNDAYSFYKDRFNDLGDFTFSFVGNFEPNSIKPLIKKWIGGLPTHGRKETWKDNGIRTPKGEMKKAVFRGVEDKSQTQIIFSGPFNWSRENNYEINSMAYAFRIKLREVLREDMGGVYGVGVWASTQHFPIENYRLTISFGCAPDRVEELTEAVYEQIDSLMAMGTTEKYLNKVQEIQRRKRETSLKKNRFWLGQLSSKMMHNQDLSHIIKLDELVSNLTLEKIQNSAKQYFDTENVVQITLYPEKQ